MPWYRTIKPEGEIRTLTTRKKLDYTSLQNQEARISHAASVDPKFTPLSAFHYIKGGTKQRIFTGYHSDENIGIMLNPYADSIRNVLWRDSDRNEVSDDIFKKYNTADGFKKALHDYGFTKTTEAKCSESVKERYEKLKAQYSKEKHDPKSAKLPWTEGLFRYQWSEIDGVVINPNNLQSCIKGYAFAVVLEENTGKPCKFYSSEGLEEGKFTEVSRDDVATKVSTSAKQVAEQYKKYLSCQELPGKKL